MAKMSLGGAGTQWTGRAIDLTTVGLVGQTIHFALPILLNCILHTDCIGVTRWRILKVKCTKFDFGWSSAPDPAGEAYRRKRRADGKRRVKGG